MSAASESDLRAPRGIVWLWAGVLAGPAAVALHQQLLYLLVTLKCSYSQATALLPVIAATFLLAAWGLWLSWRNWRRAGGTTEDDGGDASSRSRFLGLFGMMLSGLSLLTIVAMSLPPLFYRQCQR